MKLDTLFEDKDDALFTMNLAKKLIVANGFKVTKEVHDDQGNDVVEFHYPGSYVDQKGGEFSVSASLFVTKTPDDDWLHTFRIEPDGSRSSRIYSELKRKTAKQFTDALKTRLADFKQKLSLCKKVEDE